MSNQLIKTTGLGKENVFPRTRILDLFDDTSGLKLIDILRSFNMMFVPYLGNKSYTRNQISPELRRQGLWLTYVIDNTVYTEWYDEVAIDDTNWGSDSNWRQGSNALVGDLSISPNGTWVINGEDSGITIKGDKGDSPVIRIYDNKILVSYDKGVTYEDLNNTPVYTKFRFNSLTNTYLVSYDLGGTWQDISDEKVYHKFRYNSATNTYLESTDFGKTWSNISAEKVYYQFRYNEETNTHLVSTDLGLNWTDVSSNKVYYQFRTEGNRLLVSTDLGTTWENCSEPIAAWFRWADTSGTGNVGKVLISRDNKTWSDLSPTMTNNLYIKGYVSTVGELPTSSAAIGDIYMVGPTYDESDTTLDYPHYRMWIKLSSEWVDNGEYLSNILISLTTGYETGITMSLKAITDELNTQLLSIIDISLKTHLINTDFITDSTENIRIYNDDTTECIHSITKENADFTNLKSNNKEVLTKNITYIDSNEEGIIFASNDYDSITNTGEIFAEINRNGIKVNNITDFQGNDLLSDKLVSLYNYTDNIHVGKGFIKDEFVTGDVKAINSISLCGQTKCFTRGINPISFQLIINNTKAYYTVSNTIVSSENEMTEFSEQMYSKLQNMEDIDIAGENGKVQIVIVVDLLSIYRDLIPGETISEKILHLKEYVKYFYCTFNGWVQSEDNIGYYKQATPSGSWIGTTTITSSVPTSATRALDSSSINSNGEIKLIVYTNLSNAILHINAFSFNFLGNLTYEVLSCGKTFKIGSSTYTKDYYLRSTGNIYDEDIIANKLTHIQRVGLKDISSLIGVSIINGDVGNTIFVLPLSNFDDIKLSTTNLSITSSNFPIIEQGKDTINNCVWADNDNVYINFTKSYNLDEIQAYLNGALLLYELDTPVIITDDTILLNIQDTYEVSYSDVIAPITIHSCVLSNLKIGTSLEVLSNCLDANKEHYIRTSYKETVSDCIISILSDSIMNDFYGVGAALTESAAYNLFKLSSEKRTELLNELFSPMQCGWSVLRLCIGNSDFRISGDEYYTYDDMPEGETDWDLNNFSISIDEQYIIPIVKEILLINPSIKIIAAPWRYPKWMWGLWSEGLVYNAESATYMANYLLKFVDAYNAMGIRIFGISPINEPEFAANFSVDNNSDFILNYLGPTLKSKYPYIKITGFDGNYNVTKYYNIINENSAKYVDAIAVHTYNGNIRDREFLDFRFKFKDIPIFVTERRCMKTTDRKNSFYLMFKDICYDAIAYGARLITLWNLALDQDGNPVAQGNTGRRGIITIANDGSSVKRNLEYYMLQSLSKKTNSAIKTIGCTSIETENIYCTSYIDCNGIITSIIMNGNIYDKDVTIMIKNKHCTVCVPAYNCLIIKY